jgi:hypothetical protein
MPRRQTLHPKKHNWLLRGDYVDKKDSRGVVIADRIERCEFCPRHRGRKWNIRRWEKASNFRYWGDNVPLDERMSEAEAVEAEFLASNPTLTFKEHGQE